MLKIKKVLLKIAAVIISKTIRFEDIDLDNVLIDEKSYENNFVYGISYKTLIDAKPRVLHLIT